MLIRLDPVRIDGDAADVAAVTQSVIRSWNSLQGSLSGTAGMAGDDEGAEQWGLAYDTVVPEMNNTVLAVAQVLKGFEGLLSLTARTYNNVELYGAGQGDNASGIDLPADLSFHPHNIPKCIGAGAEGFLGDMQEVLEGALYAVGVTFPRGDTEALRGAATPWLNFAQDMTSARTQLSSALGGVHGSQLSHTPTITRAASDLDDILKDVSLGCIAMAQELNTIATNIDNTWHELQTMAWNLAIEIAIEIGISVALSFVTFGGAAAAGAVVVATRVAHWALDAALLIRRLATFLRISGSKLDDFYRILNKFQTGGFFWRAGYQAGTSSVAAITASFGADAIMGNEISSEQAWAYVLGGLAGGVGGGVAGAGISMLSKLPTNVGVAMAGGTVEGMVEGVAGGFTSSAILGQEFNLGQTLLTGGIGGAAMGGIGHGIGSVTGSGHGGGSTPTVEGVTVDVDVPDTNVQLDLDTNTSTTGTPDVGGSNTSGAGTVGAVPAGGTSTVADIGNIQLDGVTSTTQLDGLPTVETTTTPTTETDGTATPETTTTPETEVTPETQVDVDTTTPEVDTAVDTDVVDTTTPVETVTPTVDGADGPTTSLLDVSTTDKGPVLTDGSHVNPDGSLKPNVRYQTGEFHYVYETDANGHISHMYAENLQMTDRGSRLDHDPNTPGKVDGDHAGHIVGDRFGGSPHLDNLVSQAQNVNLSQYRVLENSWATAIADGKSVSVEVSITTDPVTGRPISFEVTSIIDGKPTVTSITNQAPAATNVSELSLVGASTTEVQAEFSGTSGTGGTSSFAGTPNFGSTSDVSAGGSSVDSATNQAGTGGTTAEGSGTTAGSGTTGVSTANTTSTGFVSPSTETGGTTPDVGANGSGASSSADASAGATGPGGSDGANASAHTDTSSDVPVTGYDQLPSAGTDPSSLADSGVDSGAEAPTVGDGYDAAAGGDSQQLLGDTQPPMSTADMIAAGLDPISLAESGADHGAGWHAAPDKPVTPYDLGYGEPIAGHGNSGPEVHMADADPNTAPLVTDPSALYGRDPHGVPYTKDQYDHRYVNPSGYDAYPPNDGAERGTRIAYDDLGNFVRDWGNQLDRNGGDGRYLGVLIDGVPATLEARALPTSAVLQPTLPYTLGGKLDPGWTIEISKIAPGFGRPGGGYQVQIKNSAGVPQKVSSLDELLKLGGS